MSDRSSPIRRLRSRFRPRRRPRFQGPSFNRLIPNIMTLIGLCAGLTSIRFALEERWEAAAIAIVIAAVIDGLDGRLARLLKATSRFGAEFDSLSDFLCFGIAPALLMYLWSLSHVGPFGFVPCMTFAVCMALRLARFNAALGSGPRPAYAYNFFAGVPAPAGAGLALFPIFAWIEINGYGLTTLAAALRHPVLPALVLIGTALLCVSTLPVWSFKNFKVPTHLVLPLMLGVAAYVAVLVSEPFGALAAAGLIYAAMLPYGARSYRRLKAEADRMIAPELVEDHSAAV